MIRVLCNTMIHVGRVSRDHAKNSLCRQINTQLRRHLSSHCCHGNMVCRQPESSIMCVLFLFTSSYRHGCVSFCRKFMSIERLILDIFATFLLPLVKNIYIYTCTCVTGVQMTAVHNLVPNFPHILQFLLIGCDNT